MTEVKHLAGVQHTVCASRLAESVTEEQERRFYDPQGVSVEDKRTHVAVRGQ